MGKKVDKIKEKDVLMSRVEVLDDMILMIATCDSFSYDMRVDFLDNLIEKFSPLFKKV